ncbi:glycogen synthase GlgA [Yoonia sp. 208BN28-4]|uniref:glycogen synthase GlgA n=1 Tax=Yoonia sp. 208BN28-4 TaxID=3126505 RepID=UPI0030A77D1D
MKRVLSVTSECVPLIKTGGLADVAGALPAALRDHGWDMRTLLPAYRGLIAKTKAKKTVWSSDDLFGGPAKVFMAKVDGAEMLLLDAPHLYDRAGGPYGDGVDFVDNAERFAALSWVAAEIAQNGLTDGWTPQVLHAHDWQAGLAPAYLRFANSDVKTVMTVHNIAFQGVTPAHKLDDLKLPHDAFHPDILEYWGQVSTLKAGLVTADAITTVSPTYAEELMRPDFGMGLDGVIAARSGDLSGILNGIDDAAWDPDTDPAIVSYSAKKLTGKKKNRAALCKEFGLKGVKGPLAIVVSRLSHQKGLDLLIEAADEFVAKGGGLAILGSGDPWLEGQLQALATRNPGKVGLRIGYDEALSHRMFGGGDAVLVPSRFEPCGLTQLYGLRYGTVPVVAATGGLADTVINANAVAQAAKVSTGIVFQGIDRLGLSRALDKLIALYSDQKGWTAMQKRGMTQDLGWGASSAKYAELYEAL